MNYEKLFKLGGFAALATALGMTQGVAAVLFFLAGLGIAFVDE